MVTDLYGTLLRELSEALKIDLLEPDENNTCSVLFANGTEVSIEMTEDDKNLLIGCNLGPIPPGRYRENFFRATLAANAFPFPRYGIFAYSNQAKALILFELIPTKNLHGDQLADFLVAFVKKANSWQNALEKSEIPVVDRVNKTSLPPSGMLGLK